MPYNMRQVKKIYSGTKRRAGIPRDLEVTPATVGVIELAKPRITNGVDAN